MFGLPLRRWITFSVTASRKAFGHVRGFEETLPRLVLEVTLKRSRIASNISSVVRRWSIFLIACSTVVW
jgi:hypothetical protein